MAAAGWAIAGNYLQAGIWLDLEVQAHPFKTGVPSLPGSLGVCLLLGPPLNWGHLGVPREAQAVAAAWLAGLEVWLLPLTGQVWGSWGPQDLGVPTWPLGLGVQGLLGRRGG